MFLLQVARRAPKGEPGHKDNSFREFRRICAAVAGVSSYNAKTEVVRDFFKKGSDGKGFKGDLQVGCCCNDIAPLPEG